MTVTPLLRTVSSVPPLARSDTTLCHSDTAAADSQYCRPTAAMTHGDGGGMARARVRKREWRSGAKDAQRLLWVNDMKR